MSTMNSLHDSLTRTIEIRIGLKRKVKDLEAQIEKVKYEIETYRLEEKKIISQFSKPNVQSQFENYLPSKKRKITVVCGFKGCTYESCTKSIASHRRHCKGPVAICKYCSYKNIKPSIQRKHNEDCAKYYNPKKKTVVFLEEEVGPAQIDKDEVVEDLVFESSNTKI